MARRRDDTLFQDKTYSYVNDSLYIYNILYTLFEWTGQPKGLSSIQIEKWLTHNGSLCYARTVEFGDVIQPAGSTGKNYNNEPVNVRPIPQNGAQMTVVQEDSGLTAPNGEKILNNMCVLCWDNPTRTTIMPQIDWYLTRLTEIKRSIDIVCKQLRVPYIINCEQGQVQTFNKILSDIDEGKFGIFTHNGLKLNDNDVFSLLQTKIDPSTVVALWDAYYKFKGELFTLLGFPYYSPASSAKKANLIDAEVTRDDIVISALTDSRKDMRKEFCKKVNEMFGVNLQFKLKYDLPAADMFPELLRNPFVDARITREAVQGGMTS